MPQKPLSQLDQQSLDLHTAHGGKIEVGLKVPLASTDDLSRAYTPGVAAVCRAIRDEPSRWRDLTVAGNAVAVVTDGSAVLGLGDIGPRAAMPVMEGKAALFRALADVDAWPICLDAREPDAIVAAIRAVAPGFAGINLEDISAPRCFEIEDRLPDLGTPVPHDDQHGTEIVLLAGLINATRVTGKKFSDLRITIAGAGAAGHAIVRLLRCIDQVPDTCDTVGEVIVCDSKGALHRDRDDLGPVKRAILEYTNPQNRAGDLHAMLEDADVFIGVSRGGLLEAHDVQRMAADPIVFALANPTPEISPDQARAGGAVVVATGRSDYANQVNNVLAFPGIFRGALDAKAARITDAMKTAAAHAIAHAIESPDADRILPAALDRHVVDRVAHAVRHAARPAT